MGSKINQKDDSFDFNPHDHTLSEGSFDIKKKALSENNEYNTFPRNLDIPEEEKAVSVAGESMKSSYSITQPNSEIYHALFNFTKSFVGIGALTIASAMKHAGVFLGLFGIVTWGLLWLYGVNLMVLSRRKILRDKMNGEKIPHYLPEVAVQPHRQLRSDEAEDEEEEDNQIEEDNEIEEESVRISDNKGALSDRIIQTKHGIKTYSDLGRVIYGPLGYHSVNIIIFVQQMTIVTAYFFFLDKFFPSYLVLIVIAPIWMFCDLRKISYVSFSSLSLIVIALTIVTIVSIANITDKSKSKLEYANFLEFPLFFGVWVFQFEGNTSWLQIENSMRVPMQFKKVSSIGIIMIIIFKSWLALFAYLAYVEDTEEIIIDSMSNNTLKDALGYIYCAAIVGSMPIQINPLADTIYR